VLSTTSWAIHDPKETLELYDFNQKVEGHDWTYWIKDWCRWLVSQPKAINPANDKTGLDTENANLKYRTKVYYLAGATSGKFERRCKVPHGNAIFFPVVVDEESTAELPSLLNGGKKLSGPSTTKLVNKCIEDQDNIISLEATIDKDTSHEVALLTGTLVKNRLRTDIFDLKFPRDNLWDAVADDSEAVADGYWLFIKPPKLRGPHTIHFHAVEDDFEIEVMHYLTVH
jgi:hypothetical protein